MHKNQKKDFLDKQMNGFHKLKVRQKNRRECSLAMLCLAVLSIAGGCTVGPNFVPPKAPPIARYTYGPQPAATVKANGQSQYFNQGAKIEADWWRLFKSPKIDAVIKVAIVNSPGLQAAQAGLRQSQEVLRAGEGVFYPQVDAGFSATRQKFSQSRFGGSSASSIFNLYTLTATISYALDVFGGERRTMEGLGAQVDFQQYILLGADLTLSGNIINTMIAQAAYHEEINAIALLISLQEDQIKIAEAQAEAGTVPYSNVLSLQSQLAATQATLPPLKQKVSQANHLLAILTGHAPAEWTPPELSLSEFALPGELPLSLPSDLVRQRPDILASEAQLHSSSANIGMATAAMFPSFNLNGSYGLESTSLGNLFKKNSSIWSLGANVTSPLFRGGTLSAERRAAIEAYNQSLANYRQTVLSALAQVADTLRALEHDAESLDAQSKALSAANDALKLIRVNYQAGTVNYLQVLVADVQYYQAKIGYIQAQAARLQDSVALYVAFGGGWWNAEEKVPGIS